MATWSAHFGVRLLTHRQDVRSVALIASFETAYVAQDASSFGDVTAGGISQSICNNSMLFSGDLKQGTPRATDEEETGVSRRLSAP